MIASDDPIRKYEPLWGNWQVTQLIGAGSYGRVYRVVRQDGGSYESAVKLISIPKSEADIHEARQMGMDMQSMYTYFSENAQRIMKEISIMNSLKGEANIVSYEDHQIVHEEGSMQWDILIRMELLIPLEFYFSDNQVDPYEVRRMGVEICSALETCAEYGIIHRDIKEANIFLNPRGAFKLGDFGVAREIGSIGSRSMTMRGTPSYIAPEVYDGRKYDERADIYSLGILMYKMLNGGRYPFLPSVPEAVSLDDAEQAFARRIKGEVPPRPMYGDFALRAAVMHAISFDPQVRFQSATELKTALLSTDSAPPSKAHDQKFADTDFAVKEKLISPSVKQTQKTVDSPHISAKATKIEREHKVLWHLRNQTKTLMIASVAVVLASFILVLALLLPDVLERDKASSSITDSNVQDINAVVTWSDSAMGDSLSATFGKSKDQVTYADLDKLKEIHINYTDYPVSYDEAKGKMYINGDIKTLSDLQYCANLKKVYICDLYLDSLDPLVYLTTLETLELKNCKRGELLDFDLTPLAHLTELKSLSLDRCSIKDFNVLAPLNKLTYLSMYSVNGVEDISIISDMSQLEHIGVVGVTVKEIPDLSEHKKLTEVKLRSCEITDISNLSECKSLVTLELSDNKITSIEGIEGLNHLTHLYLNGNNISNVEVLAKLDCVKWLEIMRNNITDQSPLLEMNALEFLFLDNKSIQKQMLRLLKEEIRSVNLK